MPDAVQPNAKPLRYARRKTRRDWKFFVRVSIIPLIALGSVAGLFYEEHSFQTQKNSTWTTVVPTIQNTRTEPIASHAAQYGGVPLYQVEVLISYPVESGTHTQWIPLSQPPQKLEEANLQQARIIGKKCFVRWNPANPQQILAELQ